MLSGDPRLAENENEWIFEAVHKYMYIVQKDNFVNSYRHERMSGAAMLELSRCLTQRWCVVVHCEAGNAHSFSYSKSLSSYFPFFFYSYYPFYSSVFEKSLSAHSFFTKFEQLCKEDSSDMQFFGFHFFSGQHIRILTGK